MENKWSLKLPTLAAFLPAFERNYTEKIDEFVMWSKQEYVLCVPSPVSLADEQNVRRQCMCGKRIRTFDSNMKHRERARELQRMFQI